MPTPDKPKTGLNCNTALALLLVLSMVGCRSTGSTDESTHDDSAAPIAEIPSYPGESSTEAPSRVESEAPLDPELVLQRATEEFYGIPVPNGLHLREEAPGFALAETYLSATELTNFYDLYFGGRHRRTETAVGAIYEPIRDTEPTVFINPGDTEDSPVVVVYSLPAGVDPAGPFTRRPPPPRPTIQFSH